MGIKRNGPRLVQKVGAPSRMPYAPRIHEPGSLDPRVFDVTDGQYFDLVKELQGNYELYAGSAEMGKFFPIVMAPHPPTEWMRNAVEPGGSRFTSPAE